MLSKQGFLYNLFLLFFRIFKEMPILSSIVFLFPLLSGMLGVFIYSAQANIIDIVASGIRERQWQMILISISKPLIIIVCISLIQVLSNLLQKLNGNKLRAHITLLFQNEIIEITNSINYANYDDVEFCNKLKRAKDVVGDDLVNILFNFSYAITISSSLLSIILLSSSSGYYSICFIVTLMIIMNLTIKMSTELKVRKLNRAITFEGRMGGYLSEVLTNPTVLREMKIYNSCKYFLNTWSSIITSQHKKIMRSRRNEIKVGMITTMLQSITIFVVLSSLISKIPYSEDVTIGLISTLFLALIQCSSKILTLTWPLSKLYINCSRLYDFHEFLRLKNNLAKYDSSSEPTERNFPLLELHNVNFAYGNSDVQILSNINITLHANEKLAIVGHNGSGKSTLIKLILGLYTPSSGSITWSGSKSISQSISVVFQNYIKFKLTLRENIALGNIKELNNDKLIIETMRKCGCYDIYKQLGSLDIPLGRIVDGGKELSGGQWQKLAISRAILSDSDILIFDEPTSSIDPKTEVEIFNNIINLCEGKSAIFISHRLGWAKNADRIVVIDSGKIVEMGSHEELLNLNKVYASMYKVQAETYCAS